MDKLTIPDFFCSFITSARSRPKIAEFCTESNDSVENDEEEDIVGEEDTVCEVILFLVPKEDRGDEVNEARDTECFKARADWCETGHDERDEGSDESESVLFLKEKLKIEGDLAKDLEEDVVVSEMLLLLL